MRTHISAIRAISATYAAQFLWPFVWGTVGIGLLLVSGICLLGLMVSHWWLICLIPVIIGLAIVGLVLGVAFGIVRYVRPQLSAEQRQAAKQFVAKTSKLRAATQTPYPVLIGRVLFDLVRYRQSPYLHKLVTDSTSLHREYQDLERQF